MSDFRTQQKQYVQWTGTGFDITKTKPKLTPEQMRESNTNSTALYTLKKIEKSDLHHAKKAKLAEHIYRNIKSKMDSNTTRILKKVFPFLYKKTEEALREAKRVKDTFEAEAIREQLFSVFPEELQKIFRENKELFVTTYDKSNMDKPMDKPLIVPFSIDAMVEIGAFTVKWPNGQEKHFKYNSKEEKFYYYEGEKHKAYDSLQEVLTRGQSPPRPTRIEESHIKKPLPTPPSKEQPPLRSKPLPTPPPKNP